jgi:DNA-directed RNA polymerase subunit M/transcription elongation factor TFIIS
MDEHIKNIIDERLRLLSEEMMEDIEWLWCQVYSDLNGETNSKNIQEYINSIIEKGLLGWDHRMFSDIKRKQNEQDDYILNPFEAEEGVVECNKCGSRKVYSVSVQTRAADEPMTTMAQCTVCKTKWSFNG